MERPFPRLERPRQRSGRYGSKMERPDRRRPEYKEGWRNMDKKTSALEGVARGLGKGEKDCAEPPTCGRAAWGPCHCTDKQGKQITWRIRNKAAMRMMDKIERRMRQRRRNKARMAMRKKMKSLESSESQENSS